MVLHEQDADESSHSTAHTNGNGHAAAGELGDIAATLRADWESFRRSVRRVALVEARRLQLRAVDASFTFALGLIAAVAVVSATVASSVFLIIGLRNLLARWTSGGIPELVAGAGGLLLWAVLVLTARRVLRTSMVRSTQKRLARMEGNEEAPPAPARRANPSTARP